MVFIAVRILKILFTDETGEISRTLTLTNTPYHSLNFSNTHLHSLPLNNTTYHSQTQTQTFIDLFYLLSQILANSVKIY